MPKTAKWLLILGIIMLAVGVVAFGVYLSKRLRLIVKEPKEEIDTSDWKTYRNEEYRFEIKYPDSWYSYKRGVAYITVFSTFPESTSKVPQEYSRITVQYRTDITMEKLLQHFRTFKERVFKKQEPSLIEEFNIEEINIYDAEGYKVREIFKEGYNGIHIIYFFLDKNDQGFFQFMGFFKGKNKESYARSFDQMLSTFKFK